MKWVKIENRPQNGSNYYYITGEENDLVITKQNDGDEIRCKLPDGTEKKLKLTFKWFDVVNYQNGIPYHSHTKKWFVKDGENEYPIDEIEVSKNDIAPYRNKIG